MQEREKGSHKEGSGPEESTLVESIRSMPRIRPGRAFKVRVNLYARFPGLGSYMVARREASRIERSILGTEPPKRAAWLASMGRIATAVAVVLVLALGIFGSLTFAARNSRPGDALYSIKRFREDMELSLTWDRSKKVQKSLALAEARLSELDYLITRNKLDAREVKAVIRDYGERTRAVEDILREDIQLQGAQGVAAQLKVIRTTEKNIERRLAAAGPGASLVRAAGAQVTVRDVSGRQSLDGGKSSIKYRTDADGVVSFDVELSEPGRAKDLEAYIELDGRSEVLPVFSACLRPSNGTLSGTVTPVVPSVVLNRPEMFSLKLASSDASRLAGRSIRLKDASRTSNINGVDGEVTVVTDSAGVCSFTVTKKSLDRVSRISASVLGGSSPGLAGPQDLGEVLVVGGLKLPSDGARSSDVSVRAVGPEAGPQSIELNNGLVRVTVSAGRPGQVIESVTGVTNSGRAGPLNDTLRGEDTPADLIKTSGPRLAFAGNEAAGYEVSFEAHMGQAVVSKTYRVTLARGNPYATIDCRVEVSGEPVDTASGAIIADFFRLQIPTGGAVNVSGNDVSAAGDNSSMLSFQVGAPYAMVDSNGSIEILACPIDSETYPSAWVLGRDSLALRLPENAGRVGADSSVTLLLGITDRQGVKEFTARVMRGVGSSVPPESAGETDGQGFLVTTDPTSRELKKGTRKLTLTIFKEYEKVFEAPPD